jgi:hypothetical protein
MRQTGIGVNLSDSVCASATFRDDPATKIVAPETRMGVCSATARQPRRSFIFLTCEKGKRENKAGQRRDRDRYSGCDHCGIVVGIVAASRSQ